MAAGTSGCSSVTSHYGDESEADEYCIIETCITTVDLKKVILACKEDDIVKSSCHGSVILSILQLLEDNKESVGVKELEKYMLKHVQDCVPKSGTASC